MKRTMIQYKVKADKSGENQRLVKNVYEELKANSPAGFRYVTFMKEDSVSFVHIAALDTDDGSNPLAESEAFKVFRQNLEARCDEPPVAVQIEQVGAYGFPVRGA